LSNHTIGTTTPSACINARTTRSGYLHCITAPISPSISSFHTNGSTGTSARVNVCTYESPGLTCITAAIVKSILSDRTNGSTGPSAGTSACNDESPFLTCITAAIVASIFKQPHHRQDQHERGHQRLLHPKVPALTRLACNHHCRVDHDRSH